VPYRSSNWMGNNAKNPELPEIPRRAKQAQITPQPPAQPPTTPPAPFVPPPVEGPPPVMSNDYIPGYLRSIIGKNVRAEFIIGSSQYTDRTGVLVDVGVNYFVLHDVNSGTHIMCDLYSVKFVTVIL
jgi:hypothetical protein